MKRIISLLLIIGILCSLTINLTVTAEGAASVKIPNVSVPQGDEVLVDVNFTTETPVIAVECSIEYPTEALELVEIVPSTDFFPDDSMICNEDMSAYPYYVAFENSLSEGKSGSGKLFSIKFRAFDEAVMADYPIKVTFESIVDNDLGDIDFTCEQGNLTVTESENPEFKSYITIDGVRKRVSKGSEFSFPRNDSKGFIGYTDGTKCYDANDKIIVNNDCEFNSIYIDLSMLYGASMRLKDPSGIRYYTVINEQQVESLRTKYGVKVDFGTIIAPKDYLGENELTHKLSGRFIDVKYTSDKYYEDSQLNFKGVVGSIINVMNKNANRDFIGRGYAKITLGDFEKIIYADYADGNIQNNTRRIGDIAFKVKFADDKTITSLYKGLSDEVKASVDKYINLTHKNDDPFNRDIF